VDHKLLVSESILILYILGLDLAGCYNGFVYHTKYDRFDVISRDSIQNTGENLLSLVRSICNAEEMRDTEVGSLIAMCSHTYSKDKPNLYLP